MMSDDTPIVELLLGTTHVKVYASGRVDGALGEDGLDGERCVVINRIPQLLLRDAALAIMRAWPPGSAITGKAPRHPAGGPTFRAWWGPHGGGPLFAYPRPTLAAITAMYARGLITALGCDNDGATGLHVRHRRLGQVEHRVDIHPVCQLPFLVGNP
jgi:hypothetical protein